MTLSDSTELRNKSFLDFLVRPGDVHEVRAFGVKRDFASPYETTVSGFFDDREAMHLEATNLDQGYWQRHAYCPGVYITVNPVDPALLARANNKLIACKGGGDCAKDANVILRRTLFLDFDPTRVGFGQAELRKIMATRAEKDSARQVADTTFDHL